MASAININEIKKLFPEEWVLVGNPVMDNTKIHVLSGIPIYHSKDQKEVCYIGRDKTADFAKVTIAFAGDLNQNRKIGILRRL